MIETWKTIEKFPDYETSNTGVTRVKTGVDKTLYMYKTVKGHRILILTNEDATEDRDKRKAFSPHQLVADLYLDKVDGLDDVMHIDYNEDNNRVDNLKRCEAKSRDITYPIISDTLKEEWRIIVGFPRYSVSNLGRVKNNVTDKLRKLIHHLGYMNVNLYTNDHKESHMKVHRLVATAFLPKEDDKEYVNHIDGVRTNNLVINLEWSNSKENTEHAKATGLLKQTGEDNHMAKTTDENVRKLCSLLEENKYSYSEIAKKGGVTYAMVNNLARGARWKHISKDYNLPKVRAFKVTKDTIELIVNAFKEVPKLTNKEIGLRFGVSAPTISGTRSRSRNTELTKDLVW